MAEVLPESVEQNTKLAKPMALDLEALFRLMEEDLLLSLEQMKDQDPKDIAYQLGDKIRHGVINGQ